MTRAARLLIILALTVLPASFGLTAFFYRQELKAAQHIHTRQLVSIARYILDRIDAMDRRQEASPDPDNELSRMATAFGFERIVVSDTVGVTRYSSNPIIYPGESVFPYLTDTLSFYRAVRTNRTTFSRLETIDDIVFQTVYIPGRAGDEPVCLIVESDRRAVMLSRSFLRATLFLGILLAALLALFIGTILMVSRSEQKARSRARENEQLAMLGRTAAELAHELKNPLAVIKSSADILKKKFDPAGTHRAFTYLSDEVSRLSRLITDILGFSRGQNLSLQPVVLADFVDDFLSVRRELLGQIRVECRIEPKRTITADRDALTQIFDNLVRNAARALDGKGTITIALENNRLLFEDTGPGIPAALEKSLFSPFVSGRENGTGLGLSIVSLLCSRMGWRIVLAWRCPARFVIYLEDAGVTHTHC